MRYTLLRRSQRRLLALLRPAQAGAIQSRLATGKKVNSAIDSPVNFFTAASLNERSSQLTGLLDGISNGIQTIQAASKGIDGITKLVSSLQSTVKQARPMRPRTARPRPARHSPLPLKRP